MNFKTLLKRRLLILPAASLLGMAIVPGAQAADDATQVKFTILNTCAPNFGGGNFDLKVGGKTIANLSGGGDCTCSPPLRTYTTSDPAVLASLNGGSCPPPVTAVTLNSSSYISWVSTEITRSESGTKKDCLLDINGGDCTEPDLCAANFEQRSNQTYSTGVPDMNGNGIPDCSDPDIDGDGILNGVDNCPLVVNLNQADTDGNGVGDMCQPNVISVPWLGNPNKPHPVFSGGSIKLQAISTKNPGTDEGMALVSATWDPGDGSAPQAISVTNPRALELEHTYTGSVGQPFTAIINGVDAAGHTYTDTFKVRIEADTLEVKANMARDKALWNLHKRANLDPIGGVMSASWRSQSTEAATAAAVQAFEINGHLKSGDFSQNPYTADVSAGLTWLFNNLKAETMTLQQGNDPDGNTNGIGLHSSESPFNYITGQVIDAIVASGTPDVTVTSGGANVSGRKYKDIVQDMLDYYAWAATDLGTVKGGWEYDFFDNNGSGDVGQNDASASHWWAVGALAAKGWSLASPSWLIDQNWSLAIPHWQPAPNGSGADLGGCGYRDTWALWDDGRNTTAACLIMMNADGISKLNPRFQSAERKLADQFLTSGAAGYNGNWYDMFQTTKAMRTALDAAGNKAPIDKLNGSIDWYNNFASQLIAYQSADGSWDAWAAGTAGGYINQDMRTAWAAIILSPNLFEQGPIAQCSADPATVGLNKVVSFNASGSSHQDLVNGSIASYAWDLNGDGAYNDATGVTVSHSYTRRLSDLRLNTPLSS